MFDMFSICHQNKIAYEKRQHLIQYVSAFFFSSYPFSNTQSKKRDRPIFKKDSIEKLFDSWKYRQPHHRWTQHRNKNELPNWIHLLAPFCPCCELWAFASHKNLSIIYIHGASYTVNLLCGCSFLPNLNYWIDFQGIDLFIMLDFLSFRLLWSSLIFMGYIFQWRIKYSFQTQWNEIQMQ